MDLIKLTADSRLYNFHSHTQFCDGRAAMSAFAKYAVDMKFAHYGFSPHSPVPFWSPCNMSQADVKPYLREVERLNKKYADSGTRFYASMEIDYLGSDWGPAIPYFAEMPLDYRIGSVHFIPTRSGEMVDIDGSFSDFKVRMATKFDNDIRYVVETFYRQSSQMLRDGGFDIVGHFDKIGHNASSFQPGIEKEQWYVDLVNGLIDLIIEKGVIVELNTKAWAQHGRMFPGEQWLDRLCQAGVPVVVNSDAHYPDLINASRYDGFDMLRKHGFLLS